MPGLRAVAGGCSVFARYFDTRSGRCAARAANLGKADVSIAFNGGSLFGISNFSALARVVQDQAGEFSLRYAGDAQGVSNIEALSGTYLTEL